MLCLTLNEAEMVIIQTPMGEIQIKVTEIRTHAKHVRLAIEAPREWDVGRASQWPRPNDNTAAGRAAAVRYAESRRR
jgi:sRNA-binding carbon storage regulator CsrA